MTTKKHYAHNHYVPEWYQKRFMYPKQGKYWYLDLNPEVCESNGHRYTRDELLNWGPRSCFAEPDLYTVKWGAYENVDIEKFFFGGIDADGLNGVEFFNDFDFSLGGHEKAHEDLLRYMSVQKLRTLKGLGWLRRQLPSDTDRNVLLMHLQRYQALFCAIWSECVWLIADATKSDTKFIVSDHPVTVYNRACFPGSVYCKGFNDPDIRAVATHTYFPLSLDKVLILTNLAWARDPYQNELKLRPNPNYYHDTIFNFQDIQIHRSLSEEEVLQINYITKSRAYRYVAAAEKEWLHPENRLSSTHWKKFDDGLLLMPEPRELFMGGEVVVGFESGASEAWNAYGQRPWEDGYQDAQRDRRETKALEEFKARWAARQGPKYRGTSMHFGGKTDKPKVDTDEFHQYLLDEARKLKRRSKRLRKR